MVADLHAEALVRLGHRLRPGTGANPAACLEGAPQHVHGLVDRLVQVAGGAGATRGSAPGGATEVLEHTSLCRGQQKVPLQECAGATMPDGRVPETQEHIPMECEMQGHTMAELLVKGYFAERAMLLAYEEEAQGSTNTSNKEVGGQQGHPLGTAHEEMVGSPAEPEGNAGEQWLHWHRQKKRRLSVSAGATPALLVRTTAVSEEAKSDEAGAQWVLWHAAQRQRQEHWCRAVALPLG